MRLPVLLLAPFAVLLVWGCGGAGLPPTSVTSLASAQAAVRAASEMGADDVPRAALHLKYAREKIEEAQGYLEEGEDDEAQLALAMAEADAEVALELAKSTSAEQEAAQAEARLETVRRASEEGAR